MLPSIIGFTALLAVTTVHAGQNITVQAANSGNNEILSVSFAPPGGSTGVLNTDERSLYSLTSLVFVQNLTTFAIDLFATDNQNGKVLDYVGDFSNGAFVCPPSSSSPPCTTGTVVTQAASIVYPTGLSTDNAGDVIVLNHAPGKSPQPQVWVLQPNPGGGFQNAALVDKTHFLKNQGVVDSLVVGQPLGNNVQTGDVLVLTTNPATVLQYHIDINNPLTTPTVLIPACPNAGACIPAGTLSGGIAVLPADGSGSVFSNSVLITSQGVPGVTPGSILSFSVSGMSVITRNDDFQDNLPARLFTIRTGLQNGGALAFVAQSGPGNHGSIQELGPCANFPGDASCTPNADGIGVVATVSSLVAAPEGIAVTNTVQTATINCAAAKGGCDNFGGNILRHKVIPDGPGNLNSNLVESLCVVPTDPRGDACPGTTVLVNTVCPGFDNTGLGMYIPKNYCGASGTTGSGFALIKSLTAYPTAANSTSQFNQTYLDAEQNTDTLFPNLNGPNPLCNNNGGTAVILWAPLAAETPIVEGSPTPQLVDITDGCDTHGGGPTNSIFGVGFALALTGENPLIGFASTKYANLLATIQQLNSTGNISDNSVAARLTNTAPNAPANSPPGCVDLSLQAFNAGNYQDAADLLTNADTSGATTATTCDSIVTTNATAAFTESPTAHPPVYNPSGQVRWRLANLYHTIETRILQMPPASTWSPPLSLSASPQFVSDQCTAAACPLLPPLPPTTATLSWALVNGACTSVQWTSNDSYFNSNLPAVSFPGGSGQVGPGLVLPATPYTYTLTCDVPAGTASTQVAVTPAPSGSAYTGAGGTLTAPWTNATGNYPVTLSTGQMMSGPCTFTHGMSTFNCTPSTNITGTPSTTLDVSFPTMSVSTNVMTWPAVAVTVSANLVLGGNPVTVNWTPPAGAATPVTLTAAPPPGPGYMGGTLTTAWSTPPTHANYQVTLSTGQVINACTFTNGSKNFTCPSTNITGTPTTMINAGPPVSCMLISNGQGTLTPGPPPTGATTVNGYTTGLPPGYQATYTSTVAEEGNTVTFTAYCTSGASFGSAQVNVTH
jgi:hypothetical protein